MPLGLYAKPWGASSTPSRRRTPSSGTPCRPTKVHGTSPRPTPSSTLPRPTAWRFEATRCCGPRTTTHPRVGEIHHRPGPTRIRSKRTDRHGRGPIPRPHPPVGRGERADRNVGDGSVEQRLLAGTRPRLDRRCVPGRPCRQSTSRTLIDQDQLVDYRQTQHAARLGQRATRRWRADSRCRIPGPPIQHHTCRQGRLGRQDRGRLHHTWPPGSDHRIGRRHPSDRPGPVCRPSRRLPDHVRGVPVRGWMR